MTITVDSGAAESVIPQGLMSQFPTKETEESRRGQRFEAANGAIIENQGQRVVEVYSLDGVKRAMKFQVTEVNKALGSVARIC